MIRKPAARGPLNLFRVSRLSGVGWGVGARGYTKKVMVCLYHDPLCACSSWLNAASGFLPSPLKGAQNTSKHTCQTCGPSCARRFPTPCVLALLPWRSVLRCVWCEWENSLHQNLEVLVLEGVVAWFGLRLVQASPMWGRAEHLVMRSYRPLGAGISISPPLGRGCALDVNPARDVVALSRRL